MTDDTQRCSPEPAHTGELVEAEGETVSETFTDSCEVLNMSMHWHGICVVVHGYSVVLGVGLKDFTYKYQMQPRFIREWITAISPKYC